MTMFFAKKLNKKGFTLAELLIVVAIIAVLVAIAVPIFTGALEKARLGVHRNNARALKSMGVASIMASSKFEAAADGTSIWVIQGKYNFATEQFESMYINKTTTLKAGEYYCSQSEPSGGVSGTTMSKFGTADDAIGKIKTTTSAYYAAVITQQDLVPDANIKIGS